MKIKILFFSLWFFSTASMAQEPGVPPILRIEVRGMSPLRCGYKELTRGYYLEFLEGGRFVDGILPYMGVIYHSANGNTGMSFKKQPTESFETRRNRKGCYVLQFSCTKAPVKYSFYIELQPDGNAFVKVKPSHGDAVEYLGEVANKQD